MDVILRDLIAIPSVTGDEAASKQVINYGARFLKKRGMKVEQFAKNGFHSLVTTTKNTKKPKVMLAAHLDVVAAPSAMFNLRLEDGRYYGRGVWDMKFAAALYLRLVNELQDTLSEYDFGIMLTTDEEMFGDYGTGLIINDQGYRPEVCILPDAIAPWHIQTSAKGCYFGEVKVLGISAHGSRPWEGDSASIKLIHILQEITELFKDAQQPDTITLNIGILQAGGTSINQIPDNASAALDIRFVKQQDFDTVIAQIEDICARGGGTLKTIGSLRRAVQCDLQHPLVRSFLRQVQLQHGSLPPSIATHGTSDARYFPELNIPCILISPKGGGYHGNDEWLDQADYYTYYQVLREYIEDVARVVPPASSKALTPVDRS